MPDTKTTAPDPPAVRSEEKMLGDTTEEVQAETEGTEPEVAPGTPDTPKGMLTKEYSTEGRLEANEVADTLQPAKD